MEYKIPNSKKLFNGLASVRDYIVRFCLRKNEVLKIQYRGKTMTLDTVEKLRGFYSYDKKIFQSKVGTKPYRLVDYVWVPDHEPLKKSTQPSLFGNL